MNSDRHKNPNALNTGLSIKHRFNKYGWFFVEKNGGGEVGLKSKDQIKIQTFLNQKGKTLFYSTPLILLTVSTTNRPPIYTTPK